MSAIKRVLKRWGYAKLEDFGLVLTAEERVVATRPAVLDDGLGARVVGWRDSDLAAIELAPWCPPASPMSARRRKTASAGPTPIAGSRPAPVAPAPPVIPERDPPVRAAATPEHAPEHALEHAPEHAPEHALEHAPEHAPEHALENAPVYEIEHAPEPAVAPAPPVSPRPVVVEPASDTERADEPPDEDEWEWQIAMARARAAAEWIEEALMPPTTLPAASSRWLAARPIAELARDDAAAPAAANFAPPGAAANLALPGAPRLTAPLVPPVQVGSVPKTVIPVPQLPPAVDPRVVVRSMPVRARSHRPNNQASTQVARATPSMRHVATRR